MQRRFVPSQSFLDSFGSQDEQNFAVMSWQVCENASTLLCMQAWTEEPSLQTRVS